MFASTAGRRLSSVVGVARRMKLQARLQRRDAQFGIFLGRQVDDDQAVDAGGFCIGEELVDAIDVDRIVVAHRDDAAFCCRPCGSRATSSSVFFSVVPAFQRAQAGGLDRRGRPPSDR